MRRVLADTSYFLALVNPTDTQHGNAVAWSRRRAVALVVTESVLLELGNALVRRADRRLFLDVVRLLRADPDIMIVPASAELFERGRALFARRADKEWSVTDCTSFEVMGEMRLKELSRPTTTSSRRASECCSGRAGRVVVRPVDNGENAGDPAGARRWGENINYGTMIASGYRSANRLLRDWAWA